MDRETKKSLWLIVGVIVLTFGWLLCVVFADEGPGRLVITEEKRPGGFTRVNTNPGAILDLNPHVQPRLGVDATFNAEHLGISIVFYYFSRSKKGGGPPEVLVWRDDFGGEFHLPVGNYERKKIAESITIPIDQETLARWAALGPRLSFEMNGWSFRLHQLEMQDIRELWYILEQRR